MASRSRPNEVEQPKNYQAEYERACELLGVVTAQLFKQMYCQKMVAWPMEPGDLAALRSARDFLIAAGLVKEEG